jgi:sugar lactone lactonase YvrE
MATARRFAPEIPGGLDWFNVNSPALLADARGRLVLLEFISGSPVHSSRVLDDLDRLGYRYQDDLIIVCVHVPVFPKETRRSHVQKLINRLGIRFPVVHDPERKLLTLFGVSQLPAHVLIDRDGCVVGSMTGSGNLAQLEKVIAHQVSLQGSRPASRAVPLQNKFVPEPKGTLRFPGRIALARDRLYVSDSGHNRIVVVSQEGRVVRQYGAPSGGFIDGVGDSAAFRNPQGLVVVDDFLYVADTGNHAIRRINLRTDEVVTIAGDGTAAQTAPSTRQLQVSTPLNAPLDVAFQAGRLFIAMAGLHQIWSMSLLTNTLEVLSGSGRAGMTDGGSTIACFAQPGGLTVCGQLIYCVDALSSAVRCVDPVSGYATTLVSGEQAFPGGRSDQALAVASHLQFPQAIGADNARKSLWVADTYNDQICRIAISTRHVSRLALDHGLKEPTGLAFDNNTLYIANTNAHEILRVNPEQGRAEALNVSEEYSGI